MLAGKCGNKKPAVRVTHASQRSFASLRILAFGTDATIQWSRGLIVFPHLTLEVLLRLARKTWKAYLISLKKNGDALVA